MGIMLFDDEIVNVKEDLTDKMLFSGISKKEHEQILDEQIYLIRKHLSMQIGKDVLNDELKKLKKIIRNYIRRLLKDVVSSDDVLYIEITTNIIAEYGKIKDIAIRIRLKFIPYRNFQVDEKFYHIAIKRDTSISSHIKNIFASEIEQQILKIGEDLITDKLTVKNIAYLKDVLESKLRIQLNVRVDYNSVKFIPQSKLYEPMFVVEVERENFNMEEKVFEKILKSLFQL